MLFARAFYKANLLSHIRQFRQNRLRVYGSAFGLVAAASLARLALHQELSTSAPFTTYSLAVLCMALAGGFWPGVVTLVLSLATGSVLFLPPAFSFALADGAGWTMLMFAVFGSINVILVSGMVASILLHDEHQQFLFGELRHRSRNLFAVVQGIVSRTLMESQTVSEAKQAVEMRLAALARTHAMLADNSWTGAPLNQIVSEELVSFVNQVSCVGCDLVLNTPAAQTFSLIIHELATNAVKHGALARPEGRVTIEGHIDSCEGNDMFRFVWSEAGGPKVQPPQRTGFGSSILNGMAKRFAQNLELNYRPEGLIYELKVVLASIKATPTTGSNPRPSNPAFRQPQRRVEATMAAAPATSALR
ncbi:HWE histidine kinase domain-containing protein [Bradyrhizobium sp. USDA 4454]